MTRGKKKTGRKHDHARQGGGSEDPEAEHDCRLHNQAQESYHHETSEPVAGLAFYRSSAQLYGTLHHQLRRLDVEEFTETGVSQIGSQVLQVLGELAQATDPNSTTTHCPFVMQLSMLLPTLRKYLTWTQATRAVWSSFAAHQHSTNGGNASADNGSNTVLWAMLAQHDVLTRFSLQAGHIMRVIDANESMDRESSRPSQSVGLAKLCDPISQASSASSACSSASSTPRDPEESVGVFSPRVAGENRAMIPQIHHISMEFADVDAECKVHLAELTECLVEVVEAIAKHMCTPPAAKDARKTRRFASEVVERLIQELLEPMRQRMLATPSPSHIDLFPRLLEQSINVVLENFARGSKKPNELQAAPFEKGVMHLRTWSLKFETDFNACAKPPGTADTTPPVQDRMNLMTLDGFKRLETTLNAWLYSLPTPVAASDSSASRRISNLAGGIRSTLVRNFSKSTLEGPST